MRKRRDTRILCIFSSLCRVLVMCGQRDQMEKGFLGTNAGNTLVNDF